MCLCFKGLTLVMAFALISSASYALGKSDRVWTGEWRNGHSFFDEEAFTVHNQHGYVAGLWDAFKVAKMVDHSAPTGLPVQVTIFPHLASYYREHPKEMSRPVVDVMLQEFGVSKKRTWNWKLRVD